MYNLAITLPLILAIVVVIWAVEIPYAKHQQYKYSYTNYLLYVYKLEQAELLVDILPQPKNDLLDDLLVRDADHNYLREMTLHEFIVRIKQDESFRQKWQ